MALSLYARIEWPWVILGVVGLVPWLAVLDRTRTVAAAWGVGLLLTELFVGAVFPWIPRAISDYSGTPFVVAVAITVVIAPLLQPQFIASALGRFCARRIGCGSARTAVVGACAYVGAEWLLPKLFADTIGHGLYASPVLRQAADIAGAAGLTFLLIVANELVLAAWRAARRDGGSGKPGQCLLAGARPLAAVFALVLMLALYGVLRLRQLAPADDPADRFRVAIVQANVSHYDWMAQELGSFEAVRRILDPHFALSGDLLQRQPIDLLMWPETVYPTSFGAPKSPDGAGFDRAIGGLVTQSGVPLLFGTYERDGQDEFNVAVLLEPSAAPRVTFDSYRKSRLFPFTEYVPAWLDSDWLRARVPWAGRWTPGTGAHVLTATLPNGRFLKIAPLICYDALDPALVVPAVRAGAEVLGTLSNDSWFAYPGVQRLILIVSAFRSIETRRPQLRATPTGMSAVISATGELADVLDIDQRGTIVASVALAPAEPTLIVVWGDWLGPTALCAGLAVLAFAAWRFAHPFDLTPHV